MRGQEHESNISKTPSRIDSARSKSLPVSRCRSAADVNHFFLCVHGIATVERKQLQQENTRSSWLDKRALDSSNRFGTSALAPGHSDHDVVCRRLSFN